VTAPLTDRLLQHAKWCAGSAPGTADVLAEAALELARLESQLEAAGLGKAAEGFIGER
jgi:hypothetical protein